ncbi:MAG: alpha/beta hydrolase [Pseudomonadota bacterium]
MFPDPALFRDAAIAPETRAFNEEFERLVADLPPTHTVPPQLTRAARDAGKGIFPSGGPLDGSDWVDLPGAPGGCRVRVSPAPGTPRGIYLHIHGGGWVLGRPSHYDKQNQALARTLDITVISIEYRLAPEHPWPAAREDCLAAVQWVLAHCESRFGTDRVALGGESAGAHLSAVMALTLRDLYLADRLRGLVLNYGCFDLRLTPSARLWGERQLVLSTPTIDWFVDQLDPERRARAGQTANPLRASLKGLPPALFQIGTADPLLDDSLMMAARWAGAGNQAELAVYPGGIHAFDMFDLPIARDFAARQEAFLGALFD